MIIKLNMGRSIGAHKQYLRNGTSKTQRVLKWFHNGRTQDFGRFVDEDSGRALSVGCGRGELEKKILTKKFDELYGLDPVPEYLHNLEGTEVNTIRGAVPPIPFEQQSLDAIIAVGSIEHLPDEHGFLVDSQRCLRPGGTLYLTIPIEVGFGGLLRHIGRSIVSPKRDITSNNWHRFFEYSLQELLMRTARNDHGTGHRYYNYRYALNDLKKYFEDVKICGWPFQHLQSVNLILFVKAQKAVES